MCKCGYECKCRKPATTGVVFNPWVKQEYVFYGNMFAEADSVKLNERSLIVTNRCRVA